MKSGAAFTIHCLSLPHLDYLKQSQVLEFGGDMEYYCFVPENTSKQC